MTFAQFLGTNYTASAVNAQNFSTSDLRRAWLAGAHAEREALFSKVRAAVDKLSAGDAEALYALLGGVE